MTGDDAVSYGSGTLTSNAGSLTSRVLSSYLGRRKWVGTDQMVMPVFVRVVGFKMA